MTTANYPQIDYVNTSFHKDSFWEAQRRMAREGMLYAQLNALKSTGRYDAFQLKWHSSYNDPPTHPPVPNHLFWDSDVAKWVEAACYYLREEPNAEIAAAVDELCDMIAEAQQPDGYLNIHFTVVKPEERWANIRDLHELYNLGHLIEAAISHKVWSGNDKLMAPILRYLEYIESIIGPEEGKMHAYPGHPEIELALLRLYDFTKDARHLRLAKYFLTERGQVGSEGKNYYDLEAERRNEPEREFPEAFPRPRSYFYMQAHKPILEQDSIEGHSVRAMYLLTAVADQVRVDGDLEYLDATKRLWDNMVQRKMYVTGGIGAIFQWEGFGLDYFLPQCPAEGGCYAETCASIGVMMLAQRLFQVEENAQYGDIFDLALYNTVLGSYNAQGTAFTYVNQLASDPKNPSLRHTWFECACCPPNVLRTLAFIGGYLWDSKELDGTEVVSIHSFASMDIKASNANVSISTNYPYAGEVKIEVAPQGSGIDLHVRLPSWSRRNYSLKDGAGNAVNAELLPSGYLSIPKASGSIVLNLDFKPRFIYPPPQANQHVVGIACGPLTYCVEDVDNGWVDDDFVTTGLDTKSAKLIVNKAKDGVSYITAVKGGRTLFEAAESGPIREAQETWSQPFDLHFVPYFYRGNRGGRHMLRTLLRNVEGNNVEPTVSNGNGH